MKDLKPYIKIGKVHGLKWARDNPSDVDEALNWEPTPGNSDPRLHSIKSISEHFALKFKEYHEFRIEDYGNIMSPSLDAYYRGWIDALKSFPDGEG